MEIDLEKETEDVEFDSEEEREYIEKLNRNIKIKQKKVVNNKKIKEDENKYQDLDHYFEQIIEQKIKDKEEEMKIKPIEFKK